MKYILAYLIALLGCFIVDNMYTNSIDNKFLVAYLGGAIVLKLVEIAMDTDKKNN